MLGFGPELAHSSPDRRSFGGVSSVLDLMFWPAKNVGWYVEPGYEVTFPEGAAHRGGAIAVGLLIGR